MEKIKMVAGTVGNAVKGNKENLVVGVTAGVIGAAVGTLAQVTKVKKGFKTVSVTNKPAVVAGALAAGVAAGAIKAVKAGKKVKEVVEVAEEIL